MVILIDCRPLELALINGEQIRFIISCTKIISRDHPVQWVFVVDRDCPPDLFPESLPGTLVKKRAIGGKAGRKLWQDHQIPFFARKQGAALVIGTGGAAYPDMRIPQWGWPWDTVRPGLDPGDDGQAGATDRDRVKKEFTGGREFFLARIDGKDPEQRISLLKAFSLFKKRQLSNMQLLLAGSWAGEDRVFREKLDSYRYREDVKLIHEPDEELWTDLLAAAYGFLFPFAEGSLGLPVLEAWRAGVPVITAASGSVADMAGEAALKAKPEDPADLAGQMMILYKDEARRGRLIGKGRELLPSFTWEAAAGQIWSQISGVIGPDHK